MPDSHANMTEVEFIMDGQFLWVLYDENSMSDGGGRNLQGQKKGVYTGKIVYTSPDMKRFEKKQAVYDMTFEDDGTMRAEGKPDKNIPVEEVWKREE